MNRGVVTQAAIFKQHSVSHCTLVPDSKDRVGEAGYQTKFREVRDRDLDTSTVIIKIKQSQSKHLNAFVALLIVKCRRIEPVRTVK